VTPVAAARSHVQRLIFDLVAGPKGPATSKRIHGTPGPRWFEPDSPIRRVHGDASMYVGGIRALLLQSLHPLAMAAVDDHSGYKGDPWGRLARTSAFLATTTFGTADDAQQAIDIVRAVHRHITGTTPDGRPYRADDPHLLRWVHVAEIDSFLSAYQRYGAVPLTPAEADTYVAQAARVALGLGAVDVPTTTAELAAAIDGYRPELAPTAAAREAARFVLVRPPVPALIRAPYAVLAAAAIGLLPTWSRAPLRLPLLPVTESTVVRLAGIAAVRSLRWVMSATPVHNADEPGHGPVVSAAAAEPSPG
jgi:uncharacterized protein (DUF2236 family)